MKTDLNGYLFAALQEASTKVSSFRTEQISIIWEITAKVPFQSEQEVSKLTKQGNFIYAKVDWKVVLKLTETERSILNTVTQLKAYVKN